MSNLIVPVYLNQRLVFDLLAMLQGGISTVTAVTKHESKELSESNKASASFGLSEALSSLFKIGLNAEVGSLGKEQENLSIQEERVHTPASLFYQLRNTLLEKEYLHQISPSSTVKSGDIVEFTVKLKRNPIIETMDALNEIMTMAIVFEDKPAGNSKSTKGASSNENIKIKKQMEAFSESLKSGNTIDLTASKLLSGHDAVITLESIYLNDPAMSDLVDGEFKVTGKVIRSIDDASESINLMRKAAFSKLPRPLLEQIIGQFSLLGLQQGFDIPELIMEIEGPAIQVLPIAIYA